MRNTKIVLTVIALALPAAVQASTPTRPAAPVARAAADQGAQDNLHASAMKFLEAADARPRLELMVREITGIKVVSLHHDISTVTGEEIVVLALADAPSFREAKKK